MAKQRRNRGLNNFLVLVSALPLSFSSIANAEYDEPRFSGDKRGEGIGAYKMARNQIKDKGELNVYLVRVNEKDNVDSLHSKSKVETTIELLHYFEHSGPFILERDSDSDNPDAVDVALADDGSVIGQVMPGTIGDNSGFTFDGASSVYPDALSAARALAESKGIELPTEEEATEEDSRDL